MIERTRRWWRGHVTVETATADVPPRGVQRGAVDHVIILDGTLSTLEPGQEGNAGLLFRLLTEGGRSARCTVYYEPGQQWEGWRYGMNIALGRGTVPQILRAYGWLASHYRAGDRIFLFGYSRGAYGVRALAGAIDRIGLVRREEATQSAVDLALRHYRYGANRPIAREFARLYCHGALPIQMVGVWDTVKSLGLRWPILWRFVSKVHDFPDHILGKSVQAGYQALALHETRSAFAPEMWETEGLAETAPKHIVQQMWFAGAHGDIGGNIGRFAACRPLANIPLVWMLERAEAQGLALPDGWRARFPCDANAPMVGTRRGFGLWFIARRRRRILADPSEKLHPSAQNRRPNRWWEF